MSTGRACGRFVCGRGGRGREVACRRTRLTDWASLTTDRGQGTGGTGYDRLPGEEAIPPLHDEDSTAEAVPEPLETDADDPRDEG